MEFNITVKITFVSNIKLTESSGGMSGINNALYHQLSKYFKIRDYLYINPPPDWFSKLKSKLIRLLGLKGNYHFFSKRRLTRINKIFESQKLSGDIYFFLGFTPWIDIKLKRPYYCYNDASFATYVKIYNNRDEFSEQDLARIYQKEKLWLSNAETVFFNSQWALEETKKSYNLDGTNFLNVGVGGFVDIPESDNYKQDINFLFISREFVPKGGKVVSEALKLVRKKYQEASLWILGDTPPKEVLDQEGIIYKGFFNKSIPEEVEALKHVFSSAFCLVHPTIKDTTTLVITESAYFGCPAIASDRFAIPEFVIDHKTGFLLKNPKDPQEVADKMIYLIENPIEYAHIRQSTRDHAISNNTWDRVGDHIFKTIKP